MFKTINNIFSTKRDLLAIGLFIGAFVALMLFELFGWLFSSVFAQVFPAFGTESAVIKFLTLSWQLFAVAITLFTIERLYNRLLRNKQQTSSSAEQLYNRFVHSDHLKYKSMTATGAATGADIKTVTGQDSGRPSNEAFTREYLEEHNKAEFSSQSAESQNSNSEDALQALQYQRKEHLRLELARLLEPEETLKDTVETLDLIDILTQDFRHAASSSGKLVKDLSPEQIRSVLAKR